MWRIKINLALKTLNDSITSFNKSELNEILNIYGIFVSNGQWKDYGISTEKEKATFYIFKNSSENPIYIIEKNTKLSKKNQLFTIKFNCGKILKRGNNLRNVLKIFNRSLLKII